MHIVSWLTLAALTSLIMVTTVTGAGAAPLSYPLGCGARPTDFRVTTFATGLSFPYGMERLPDGSLLVATSVPKTATSGYFATTGELRRFVDSNADGIADDAGTVVFGGLPGALTAVRRAGSLLFVTSAASGITVLRIGQPYTRVGEITLQFPLAGGEQWYHGSYALEVRPTPGAAANTFDVFFNIGSQFNSQPTTGRAQVGGLITPSVSVNGDAIHKITVTDGPGAPVFSAPVQIASGLRNAAGIALHPVRGDLYFADNGIDGLVDDTEPLSADELNVIPAGQIGVGGPHFFGFPDSYTEYRTGSVVGGAGIPPVATFQPLPGMTAPESEGPALIAVAPPAFPPPLDNGVFIGFHGQPAYGIANEENPVLFYSFADATSCHFVSNDEPHIGHPNGLLSTADALFMADMASNGSLGAAGAATGVIYQIAGSGGAVVSITATDAIATEAGPTAGTLTVTRSGSTAGALTVAYTVTGTGSAGADYQPLSGSVTIPAGSASATIAIDPIDDGIIEANEPVVVTLASGIGYTVGVPGSATVTIVSDDKPSVTITATDAIATEAGRTTATFTVVRTGSTAAPLTVFYAVSALGGMATAGTDYLPLPGAVTIPTGAVSAAIVVTPIDDTLMEGSERVVLALKANTAYTVGTPSTATVTIVSDEHVSIAATDATATEAGPTPATFTVSRTGSTSAPLTVLYAVYVLGGMATAGADYVPLPGSVTIPAGATEAPVVITPLDDALMEGGERVVLVLKANAAYTIGASSTATVTILSDERVTIAATDPIATEAGATTATFTVSRTGSTAAPLTVFYAAGGTAIARADYLGLSGSVVMAAGQGSAAIVITPINDILMEGSETVVLTLKAHGAYTIGTPSTATVTIVSDEQVSIAATDASATEAGPTTATFTVSRIGSTGASLTVFYTVGGTATAGTDYVAVPGSVVIPAGAISSAIVITPVDDTVTEGAETVVVAISPNASYTRAATTSATVTITSDE